MTNRIEAALAELPKTTPGPWLACCDDPDEFSHYVFANEGELTICGLRSNDPDDYRSEYEPGEGILPVSQRQANAKLLAAAPDLAAEVIRLREEVAKHATAETALLARVREKIEGLSVIGHPDYICDFIDKDAALRAVDEVEKEARG